MSEQKFFKYQFNKLNELDNFFVNKTNKDTYDIIINSNMNEHIFLLGPDKSGKTHLLNIWVKKNNAIKYNNNFQEIISSNQNVAIDNIFETIIEEEIFHIINHCNNTKLKILSTSNIDLMNFKFNLKDLYSRMRTFYHLKINDPDEEMCKIILTKLLYERQVIVKNNEIFDFIFNRVKRTYKELYLIIEKLDNLSLEKKRQLTIPLIKEIL